MDRLKHLRVWLLALDRFERSLRVETARNRNTFLKAASKDVAVDGQLSNHVSVAHRDRIEAILDDHYRRVVPYFGRLALARIESVEKKYAQTLYDALVAEWIGREALRKATMIADTDRDDVLRAIESGLTDGLGTEQIARNIRKVSRLTPFRAATVARTETHAAATYGSVETVRAAERDLGVRMTKEWLATRDDRTRPEHLAADGQRVGMDEKFTVGGVMMDRPGDPSAPIETLVNCRCAMAFSEAE